MPPASIHVSIVTENAGVCETSNPPYPCMIVGVVPSSFRPLLCEMNIGTRVPSFELKKICFDS